MLAHKRPHLGNRKNTQLALLDAQVDSEHAPPAHAPGSADLAHGREGKDGGTEESSERRPCSADEQDALDGTPPCAAALPHTIRHRTDYPHVSCLPSSRKCRPC